MKFTMILIIFALGFLGGYAGGWPGAVLLIIGVIGLLWIMDKD
jgi:hypothetical protein